MKQSENFHSASTSAFVGVGLRSDHFEYVLRLKPPVPWFEIVTENFMVAGGKPLLFLERLRRDYPIALHGVSMNLGSTDPLNKEYLGKLKWLIDTFDPEIVSDHLCWTGVGGENLHNLLPLPYTEETLLHLVDRIREVQDFLGKRLLIENVSTYLEYTHSEMREWDFLSQVCEKAGSGILLDINNIFVSSVNHGFDAKTYVDSIPTHLVGQFHLAGHSKEKSYLVDTHDHPVNEEVWALYGQALRKFGPIPTLIEWDNKIPPFEALFAEAKKAENLWLLLH